MLCYFSWPHTDTKSTGILCESVWKQEIALHSVRGLAQGIKKGAWGLKGVGEPTMLKNSEVLNYKSN